MAEKLNRNVEIVADDGMKDGWFDIYLDFSGNREYLMPHRQNGRLYSLLKDGLRIEELERNASRVISDASLSGKRHLRGDINPRLKCRKNWARKLENTIGHLVTVANEYIQDMARAA